MSNAKKRKHPIIRAFATVVAVLVLLVVALSVIPLFETGDKAKVEGSDSWMARLDDATPLNQVVLPGTHDSATQYVQLPFFAKCQSLSIAEQLEAGYRYLDVRLGDEGNGDSLKLMHGFTNCKTDVFGDVLRLDDVLAGCYAFLDAHPTETIVFAVKQEHGDVSVEQFQHMLDAAVGVSPQHWLLTDRIPTVGEARGKLVLLRRYDDEAGLGARAGIPFNWAGQGKSAGQGLDVVAEPNGSFQLWVQDRYEYGNDDKWTAFTTGMRKAAERMLAGDVALHFLSTKGTLVQGHPFAHATDLNPRLAATSSPELSGWIVVDFASAPLAAHIYEANFA